MRKSNKQTWFFNVIICKNSGVFFIFLFDRFTNDGMSYWCRLLSMRAAHRLVIFSLSTLYLFGEVQSPNYFSPAYKANRNQKQNSE